MQCLILAGGLGTRLGPLTKSIPKALVDVDGHPFAHYQLRYLADQGFTKIVYCIGHYGEQIREFAGDGSRYGLEIAYVDEGSQLMGTGGAVRKAYDAGILERDFFIMYGDSYLPIEFVPVLTHARERNALAVMTVFHNEGKLDQSNCHLRDGMIPLYSKDPAVKKAENFQYIDYGLTVWQRALAESLPRAVKMDLAEIYTRMSVEGLLHAFEVKERFYEVGSVEGLESFKNLIRRQKK